MKVKVDIDQIDDLDELESVWGFKPVPGEVDVYEVDEHDYRAARLHFGAGLTPQSILDGFGRAFVLLLAPEVDE